MKTAKWMNEFSYFFIEKTARKILCVYYMANIFIKNVFRLLCCAIFNFAVWNSKCMKYFIKNVLELMIRCGHQMEILVILECSFLVRFLWYFIMFDVKLASEIAAGIYWLSFQPAVHPSTPHQPRPNFKFTWILSAFSPGSSKKEIAIKFPGEKFTFLIQTSEIDMKFPRVSWRKY